MDELHTEEGDVIPLNAPIGVAAACGRVLPCELIGWSHWTEGDPNVLVHVRQCDNLDEFSTTPKSITPVDEGGGWIDDWRRLVNFPEGLPVDTVGHLDRLSVNYPLRAHPFYPQMPSYFRARVILSWLSSAVCKGVMHNTIANAIFQQVQQCVFDTKVQ